VSKVLDEIARRSKEFIAQGGGRMSVSVVKLADTEELVQAGDAGSEDARRLVGCLTSWIDTCKRAVGEGMEHPRCLVCQEALEPEDIDGVIILAPDDGYGVALVTPVCHHCGQGRDYAAAKETFLALVTAEYGGEIHKVQ